MRRLARHAFTVLSALSLLLCVAACVLWVRSHRVEDSVKCVKPVRTDGHQVTAHAATGKGGLGFVHWDHADLL